MINDFIMTLLMNAAVFSILFLFMVLVRKIFSNMLSVFLQYMLWFLVVLKLVIPFGFESSFNLLDILKSPKQTEAVQISTIPEKTMPTYHLDSFSAPEIAEEGKNALNKEIKPSPVNGSVTPAQKQIVPNTGWQVYAFIIWVAGFFAAGIWHIISSMYIRHTIVYARANPQTNVIELFQRCKYELGIKQKINVIMQWAIPSPALMGLFRPMLILPEHLNHMDEQTVRHVIMHELMHLKNKDLPVIFLLNI